jgi:hypothetical protein
MGEYGDAISMETCCGKCWGLLGCHHILDGESSRDIWWFPKSWGYPHNISQHPFIDGFSLTKTIHLGYTHLWKPPYVWEYQLSHDRKGLSVYSL